MSYYEETIDINKNSVPDFTTAFDRLQGFCEDRVYCAAYSTCGSLNIYNCKKLVCDYMEDTLSISNPEDQANRLVDYDAAAGTFKGWFQPGECWSELSNEQKKIHWFSNFIAVDDIMYDASEGKKCSLLAGSCNTRWADIDAEFAGVSDEWWIGNCEVYD